LMFDSEADMAPFLDLHTADKEAIAVPGAGELVITDKIANDFGIKVGDTVTLRNEDMQTITAKVSGINQNFIYNYVYINSETYSEQTGKPAAYRNLYLNIPEDSDVHLISAALMKWEDVASVTVNADTMERFSGMMRSLDLIVVFVIGCAAGLAFIVLYNLTNINITERIREIATIKVLGFHKRETSSYVFRENMVLAGMGIAVGLPLGHLLHLFVMNEIRIDMIAFDIRVRPVSYLYSVILTYLFAWMVNLMMGGKLERISMTESLKSVD
jgi:ABC-type transport system, involved in lipoprotein release, permease component